MKYEIGEQLKGTEKKGITEHYYLFVLSNNSVRYYLCSQLGSHKIWLSSTGYVYVPGTNGREICDDAGYLEFKSIEDIKKWLDDSPVYVKVGFGNFRKRLSGFNHYQTPEIDKDNLHVEREIYTEYEDAVHLVPVEEKSEGISRVLKPTNRW